MKVFGNHQDQIEVIVDRYEDAWHAGANPTIEDFLPESCETRERILWELAQSDLELRIKAGQPILVEDYLRRFPTLHHDTDRLAHLVRAEYRLRARRDPSLHSREYARRFPGLYEELIGPGPHDSAARTRTVASNTADHHRFTRRQLHREGGLGCVWLAHDEELDRSVALKEVKEALTHDEESRRRFMHEAMVTSKLEHPGIVPVYGKGEQSDGRPYYAMRFVKGRSLREAIREFHAKTTSASSDRSVELSDLLRRFLATCNAIHYAHECGVLHRDIKPDNIMVGDFGETLIVDWGLAKSGLAPRLDHPAGGGATPATDSATETRIGQVLGSPGYMSPEQARGEQELDARSDVYGLGATLYTLLTNRAPLAADKPEESVTHATKITQLAPISGESARPLAFVCLKAMARHPHDRYTSAGDLAEDLERFLANEPTRAHHESFWEKYNGSSVDTVVSFA